LKRCNLLGSSNALNPSCNFAHAVVTWTSQPTNCWMDIGLNQFTLGTAAAAGFGTMNYEFDGACAMEPGCALSLVATAASATTWWVSFVTAEMTMPSGQL
jgi:hypothetical protein